MESFIENKKCETCQTVLAPGMLACPSCLTLVNSKQLKELANEAQQKSKEGDYYSELVIWRKVLDLLPETSQQFQSVQQKIDVLIPKVDKKILNQEEAKNQKIPYWLAGMGSFGLIFWKFKFILVFLLTKAKVLLLGLTKAETFFSMLLFFGVYWSVWGWKFALGIVLSIYIHEMGHVLALRKLGMASSLPIFIPGIGALIRLKQTFINPIEDARIGLAGPIAGLLAALACYAVYLSTGFMSWAAIAKVGAWINLFNLLPISPLDGGRGFHALSKKQKWLAISSIGLMWYVTHEGLLFILLLAGVYNVFQKSTNFAGDRRALIEYIVLIVILSLLTMIHVRTV